MLSVRLEHGVPINTLFFYPMTFGSALYFVGLEAWPTFFLVAFLVLYLLMQWVPFDAHHGDPLVQIGQWADKVRCCSLKVEILFLEKLEANISFLAFCIGSSRFGRENQLHGFILYA